MLACYTWLGYYYCRNVANSPFSICKRYRLGLASMSAVQWHLKLWISPGLCMRVIYYLHAFFHTFPLQADRHLTKRRRMSIDHLGLNFRTDWWWKSWVFKEDTLPPKGDTWLIPLSKIRVNQNVIMVSVHSTTVFWFPRTVTAGSCVKEWFVYTLLCGWCGYALPKCMEMKDWVTKERIEGCCWWRRM